MLFSFPFIHIYIPTDVSEGLPYFFNYGSNHTNVEVALISTCLIIYREKKHSYERERERVERVKSNKKARPCGPKLSARGHRKFAEQQVQLREDSVLMKAALVNAIQGNR